MEARPIKKTFNAMLSYMASDVLWGYLDQDHRSWCIKGTDESPWPWIHSLRGRRRRLGTLSLPYGLPRRLMDSSVPLMYYDQSKPTHSHTLWRCISQLYIGLMDRFPWHETTRGILSLDGLLSSHTRKSVVKN